jgi:hypothetical protein
VLQYCRPDWAIGSAEHSEQPGRTVTSRISIRTEKRRRIRSPNTIDQRIVYPDARIR